MVTVVGSGLGGVVVCDFGGKLAARSERVSATRARCVSPPNLGPVGSLLELRVSANGQQFATAPAQFAVYAPERTYAATPAVGSTRGGTRLIVSGAGFSETDALSCFFGTDWRVAAAWLDPRHVECVSPPLVAGTSVQVGVASNGADVHWAQAAAFFEFFDVPTYAAPQPRRGPQAGGSPVSFTLSNSSVDAAFFQNATCRFGSASFGIVVTATTTASGAACVAPPSAVATAVDVFVAHNGVDYSRAAAPFRYDAPWGVDGVDGDRAAYAEGGGAVAVRGFGFLSVATDQVACRLGALFAAEARVLDDSTLLCGGLPAHAPQQAVALSVPTAVFD